MRGPEWLNDPLLDWFFRLLVVVLFINGILWASETRDRAQCQSRYNETVAKRTQAIAEALDQERKAESQADAAQQAAFAKFGELIGLVAHPLPNDDDHRTLFRTLSTQYNELLIIQNQEYAEQDKERKKAAQTREAYPPPPLPSEVCD